MNKRRRHELTNDQWARLAPLLPKRTGPGRRPKDHRLILNALYWLLRTGAPWRDLPERFGPWGTVYSRFRRWRLAGVWDQLLAALQAEADAAGRLDWSLHFVDGSVVRAHQHAAGAKKGAATKPLAGAEAASVPSSTSGSIAAASRW